MVNDIRAEANGLFEEVSKLKSKNAALENEIKTLKTQRDESQKELDELRNKKTIRDSTQTQSISSSVSNARTESMKKKSALIEADVDAVENSIVPMESIVAYLESVDELMMRAKYSLCSF